MTTEQLYELFLQHPSVQTDTRKLKEGDIFFALSGPNFNGNQFALKAIESGASYAVVDEEIANDDGRILKVDNVLESLQLLAKHHREQFHIPFIAITGSNGKTTTKELVSVVLSSHYKTYTTQGNLNNHIGIPITLLGVGKDAQMAVIEMGANHRKEIESYCRYTGPTHGIITNCGKAHLEGFGGIEGVKKGKGELFDYLRLHNGSAFLFKDYPYLQEMATGVDSIITYGTSNAQVTGRSIPSDTFLRVELTGNDQAIIQTQLVGDYNLPNVLCAAAVGRHFSVPIEKIIKAIEDYAPGNSRSQMQVKGSNHIILDAYNANPSSMKVAIENIANIKAGKKVLMLGGMMELGEESVAEHENVLDLIKKNQWDHVVLVGGDFAKISHPFIYFDSSAAAADWVKKKGIKDSYILIKGSRSVQMEKIAEAL
ncbi:UDP-N-acetylmuramoyl-tripeptide--D-alanyl-D-alanine ligase [Segetibacter aerophilus]|uniref:UDP-N-acetylmuramoyl-tripeptide--D-alanyl-D-alanine ligase n=1 Tax=Segetibacter aerophilus TaxID=670293 RepID=A0A512BBC9_9BACT|nr:UDP-N-acetylmuramoyl-tripeptide--D-alanyl-D-alanine ligase [Segetibacter aerophilus]GEO09272.1 UDP-N-acetylmuramoyl-tripeptide--D-alanyl-D-alanine ligase [Segetibacter aerophilus]